MSKLSTCFFISAILLVGGCTSTPSLPEATGVQDSRIFIKDVVQRVKCELSDAFDKKIGEPDYLWLAGWTAHADLTLTINDNAGISPSGSYTRFQRNAVNTGAGPSSFPATSALGVVNQFFTVSATANLSGQAVRTETLSFTVALNDLRTWREKIDKQESDPTYPDEDRICNFSNAIGVTGNLGLKEWVESAFYPAEKKVGQLKAGVHTATSAKANSPQIPQPGKSAPSAGKLNVKALGLLLKTWSSFLAELSIAQAQLSSSDDLKKALSTAQSTIRSDIRAASEFRYVLEDSLKRKYYDAVRRLKQYANDATKCYEMETKLNDNVKAAQLYIAGLEEAIRGADDNIYLNRLPDFPGENYRKLRDLMYQLEVGVSDQNKPNLKESSYVLALRECDTLTTALGDLSNSLPKQVDPPIDSLLHSVTFVISYGAGVTPSWSLLQWKGPGQNPNFVSASGVRTHGLVIAVGPPSGTPPVGQDANRLIQLQAIRAINQQ
jgi:hypothetical protein